MQFTDPYSRLGVERLSCTLLVNVFMQDNVLQGCVFCELCFGGTDNKILWESEQPFRMVIT